MPAPRAPRAGGDPRRQPRPVQEPTAASRRQPGPVPEVAAPTAASRRQPGSVPEVAAPTAPSRRQPGPVSRQRSAARRPATEARRRQARAAKRARRIALLSLLVVVLVVTLALTAFGGGSPAPRVAPTLTPVRLPVGPPRPQVIALQGQLRIQLPIAQPRVTAVGYHASSDGSLPLQPFGKRANAGFLSRLVHKIFGGGGGGLRWYQLPGGQGTPTGALDVGAPAGSDVYSPVDGTIVGLTDFVLNGRVYGKRIDIQPAGAPSVVVTLTCVRPDPSLTVGSSVAAGSSRIGTVVDVSRAEHQALAAHTQDAGNHVTIEVRPAATLPLS